MDLFPRALSVIYMTLVTPEFLKCVKWDRDLLGCTRVFVVDRRSVLVVARWINKEEVLKLEVQRLIERGHLSGSFWWFTTGHKKYS